MNYNQIFGRCGEHFAQEMLIADGYHILVKNYRCKLGEIDIIAERNGWIHFIEVKTRRNNTFGYANEAITGKKRAKIKRVAEFFLNETKGNWRGISFDAYVIEAGFIENCM